MAATWTVLSASQPYARNEPTRNGAAGMTAFKRILLISYVPCLTIVARNIVDNDSTYLWHAHAVVSLFQFPQHHIRILAASYAAHHTTHTETQQHQTNMQSVVRVWRLGKGDSRRVDDGVLSGKEDT